MTKGYPCPKCGGVEWKKVKVHQEIKQCTNCSHSPFLDHQIEMNSVGTFTEWLTGLVAKEQSLEEELKAAEAVVNGKPESEVSFKELATLRRADRQHKEAHRLVEVAERVSALMSMPYAEGAVTVNIPEIGLFTQFSWGDYDLFSALKKTTQST